MTKNNQTAAEIPTTSSGVFCHIPVDKEVKKLMRKIYNT